MRRTSSICLQVTGLIEPSIAQELGAGSTAFQGIVRRVGTRTQLENIEWIVLRTCGFHPQSTTPARSTLGRGGPNQLRSAPRPDFAREWNRLRINSLHDVLVIRT